MTGKIVNFIKYNNAFTIIVLVCFLGFGVTFAASPDLRENVYASQETVVAVDNGRIVTVDLDNFNFNLKINSVTEDDKNYYAVYSYQTLAVVDGVWQEKLLEKNLTVSKESLMGKDFGLYLAKQLGDNVNYELSYLQKVQKLEREKGESQKVVAVEYSGLIGKILDPKEMTIEGYNPVIPEPMPKVSAEVVPAPEEIIVSVQHPETVGVAAPNQNTASTATTTDSSSDYRELVDPNLVSEVVTDLLQASTSSSPVSEPPITTPADSSNAVQTPETPEVPVSNIEPAP